MPSERMAARIVRDDVPAVDPAASRTSRSWEWICSALVNKESGECSVDILETIFLQREQIWSWFYTSSSGVVCKKPQRKLTPANVGLRLSAVAHSHEQDPTGFIAACWFEDQRRLQLLSATDCQTYLESCKGNACVSAFVQPRGGLDPTRYANLEHEFVLIKSGRVQAKLYRLALGNQRIMSRDNELNKLVTDMVQTVISFLERTKQCRVVNCRSYFITDEFGRVRLWRTEGCQTISVVHSIQSSDGSTIGAYDGPHAISERVLARAKADADKKPNDKLIQAILSSPTPASKRQTVPLHVSSSQPSLLSSAAFDPFDSDEQVRTRRPTEVRFRLRSEQDWEKAMEFLPATSSLSRGRKRTLSAAHLVSSQKKGCFGDYCDMDVTRWSSKRLSSRSPPRISTMPPFNHPGCETSSIVRASRSSSVISATNAATAFLTAHPDVLTDDIVNRKPMSPQRQQMQDAEKSHGEPPLGHRIPFKLIAQTRAEKQLVDLFIKRYQRGEDGDYLAEIYYGDGEPLGQTFPGYYYQDMHVCNNCFAFYTLVESARMKALGRLQGKKFSAGIRIDGKLGASESMRSQIWNTLNEENSEADLKVKGGVELEIASTAAHLCKRSLVYLQDSVVPSISKKDAAELFSFVNPHPAVSMVIGALGALLLGCEDSVPGEIRRNLSQDKLLTQVQHFDLQTLQESRVKKVVAYARNSLFCPSQITPISVCAGKFCDWILTVLQAFAWKNYRAFCRDARTWELLAFLKPELAESKFSRQAFLDAFFRVGDPASIGNGVELTTTGSSTKKKAKAATMARRVIQDQQMARLSAPTGPVGTTPHGGNDAVFTCSDGITTIPYTITGQASAESTKCNLIVFNDFFDTMDSTKVFFRWILARHVGARALFFNLPGQAGSLYSVSDPGETQTVFNNNWCAHRVHELLEHLQETQDFITSGLPFHLVGFGNGANIATCFAVLYGEHLAYSNDLQSLVLLNGFSRVDSQLAAILHSSLNVFPCLPTTRPDLPVTFFSKFLFSQEYLTKIDINLALSIYTAVTNPITLDGRIRICQGALHHTDLTPQLPRIRVPIVLVQSVENSLIAPASVDPFLHQRVNVAHSWSHQQQMPGSRSSDVLPIKTKKQLYQTLATHGSAFVAWLRAGHELRQEAKHYVMELLEVVICSKEAKVHTMHVAPQDALQTHIKALKTTRGQEDTRPNGSTGAQNHHPQKKNNRPSVGANLHTNEMISELSSVESSGHSNAPRAPFWPDREEKSQQKLLTSTTPETTTEINLIAPQIKPMPSVGSLAPVRSLLDIARPFIPPPEVASNPNPDVYADRQRAYHQTIDAEIEATRVRMEAEEKRLEQEAESLRQRLRKATEERMEALQQEQERRRRQWEEEDRRHLLALEAKLRAEEDAREAERRMQQCTLLLAEDLISGDDAQSSSKGREDLEVRGSINGEFIRKDESTARELIAPDVYAMKQAIRANPDLSSMFDRMEAEEKARQHVGLMRADSYAAVKATMTQNFNHHVKQHEHSLRQELLRRKEGHAIHIQKHIRRFLAVQRVVRIRRNNQEESIRRFAGGEIVRIVRGFIGRRRFLNYRRRRTREVQERSSAVAIQRLFRGFMGRIKFRKLLRNKKVVDLQRVYRGYRGRLYCEELREAQIQRRFFDQNATKLQATWRMHVGRDHFLSQRISLLAANEIQRIYRGHLGRLEAKRKRAWHNAEPGPERLALGLKMIEGSKQAFERQQNEIDALHRAQETVERQVSTIHAGLQESEKELAILERELQEIDQLEADLRELTHEAELIHSRGLEGILKTSGTSANNHKPVQLLGSGIPLVSPQKLVDLPSYEIGSEDSFEGRCDMKKRQADAYAVEMAIQIKRAEREKKKKDLEAEFTSVFAEVQQKRQLLAEMEEKLADMESTRMRKDREFARMQRNLMELLEEQKLELENLREKGIELETATATSAAAAAATAMKAKEHEKRSQAMFESTEELMKFQFMSMSLSYFSSLNMLKNLRDINADTTAAAITSTAETAAAAAAAAAAANIPAMKRIQVGGADLMMAASQLKKSELEKRMKEEEDAKQSHQEPLPDQVNDWTVDDVGRWLDTLSLSMYKKAFREGAVDGEFLLELRPEDMSDVLGVSHKLHVRKIIVARNRLLPLSQQEQLQIDAVEHEEHARNARQGPGSSISSTGSGASLDVDTVFSQARNGRIKRLIESVDAGFDVNVEDEKGNTLLLIACQNVNLKMVEYLVAKRANINHKNAQGNTPLHFAMAYDTEGKLGEYLIAHGADDTIENSFGLTAYDGLQPE